MTQQPRRPQWHRGCSFALSRLEEVGAVAAQRQEERHAFDQSHIAMMQGYAELRDCRHTSILNYFGEETDEPCGFCDTCDAGIAIEATETAEPFALNSRVAHAEWGDGTVMRYEGDKITVLFDAVGYKSLAVPLVLERSLLRVAEENG